MLKKILIINAWLFTSFLTLIVSTSTIHFLTKPQYAPSGSGFTVANGLSNVLSFNQTKKQQGIKTQIHGGDARPYIIEAYLRRYNSPMADHAQLIADTADQISAQYPDIDATHLAYMTIAIAQNESNLGKRMPPNCYNAWGWGIHSAGTLCFDSWEEGIALYMKGLGVDYMHERGLITPEDIMTIYTPHSPGGAWAKNVSSFMEKIETATF